MDTDLDLVGGWRERRQATTHFPTYPGAGGRSYMCVRFTRTFSFGPECVLSFRLAAKIPPC